MEAQTRNLQKIFDHSIQYQIPLFQRPYVWDVEKGWQDLWEDIEDLLSKQLIQGDVHPHFLGAVVLEQLANKTGAVEIRQIIDGQQRFTTLQIFMLVCRDHANHQSSEKYAERFGDLVSNRENRVDHEDETYKLWPTNSDRSAYRLVHGCGSMDALEKKLKAEPDQRRSNIVGAYQYFSRQLALWFAEELEGEGGAPLRQPVSQERLDALWNVVRGDLQLVVIDLEKQDEAQVIFETMNALGEPLLPADLIKNFLFRRALAEGADVEKLYRQHWEAFDAKDWRSEAKQGRAKRPRIDLFLSHYLALMTQDEVKTTHLFQTFKAFAGGRDRRENTFVSAPVTVAEHMSLLARFGRIYRGFESPDKHPRLATFLRRLEAVDTTTVYPFLLLAHDALMPDHQPEFDRILVVIESFLIRRMVCGLTNKAYNRLFIDLTKAVAKSGQLTAANVSAWLARSQAESHKFPSDVEFQKSLLTRPIYEEMAKHKVRTLLEAADAHLAHSKSEAIPLPTGLTIEHVLPQAWTANWLLSSEAQADPAKLQEARIQRWLLLHSLGNLTLITASLNPSISNAGWEIKRPELLKFSKLNLTRYFFDDEHAKIWDEQAIMRRGQFLSNILAKLWPGVQEAVEVVDA